MRTKEAVSVYNSSDGKFIKEIDRVITRAPYYMLSYLAVMYKGKLHGLHFSDQKGIHVLEHWKQESDK